jgi:hypothetical protein
MYQLGSYTYIYLEALNAYVELGGFKNCSLNMIDLTRLQSDCARGEEPSLWQKQKIKIFYARMMAVKKIIVDSTSRAKWGVPLKEPSGGDIYMRGWSPKQGAR